MILPSVRSSGAAASPEPSGEGRRLPAGNGPKRAG